MPWVNNDGLTIRFGAERIEPALGGEYPGAGEIRVIEAEFDGVDLVLNTPVQIGGWGVIIPRNSRIDSVEVIAETVLTAPMTSLDIGLQQYDDTEYDYDGLVDGILIANLNVSGEKNVYTAGVAGAGALVGVTTTIPSNIVVTALGGVPASGRGIVRVKVYVPSADANPGQFEV